MGSILGISAYYHDSAAAFVRDGEVVAAAQEERFSRAKHDPRFPRQAINYCLGEAFIDPSELDAVVFYESPVLTLDRVVENAVSVAPEGRETFTAACKSLLGMKFQLARDIEETLGCRPRLFFARHHEAHAASAFYPSPFDEAAILTIDGVGEWATCTIGRGSGDDLFLTKAINYPHSLGLLYSAFTYHCGFKVNSGEYKVMGLAPYGTPRFAQRIRDELIDIKDDGSFRLNTACFGYLDSPLMTNERFEALFGGPARIPEAPISERELDLAASVQAVVEEVVLKLGTHALERAGSRSLVMAGGVALNCVANGKLAAKLPVDGLFVQPAAGDAGGALGAALLGEHALGGTPRHRSASGDGMKGALLGPTFPQSEIEAFLDRYDIPHERMPDPAARASLVAKAIADGAVVGLFAGRMEFGPRALGARSIIADPRRADMQRRINEGIKYREDFRPFAPAVLREHVRDYFALDQASPYMTLVAPVVESRRDAPPPRSEGSTLSAVHDVRSDVPAVTHVDYSARVQTVDEDSNPEFLRILQAFHEETGCPLLVNTSFNVRGEPIVGTPQDAYRCFVSTGMDLLVIGEAVLRKPDQPAELVSKWRRDYEPD